MGGIVLSSVIHWAGDWLLDEYLYGRLEGARFVPEGRVLQPGGALCAQSFLQAVHPGPVKPLYEPDQILRLTRYVEGDRILMEAHQYDWDPHGPRLSLKNFYNPYSVNCRHQRQAACQGLLLSFYGKGMARMIQERPPRHEYRVVVIDSRYREFRPSDLNSPCMIWHATGQEFNEEYAYMYDWVVHTNGGQDIQVGRGLDGSGYKVEAVVPVQNIVGKSTVGAGDAFSAALCSFLTAGTTGDITAEDIIRATELAARYTQERILASTGLTISPN